MLERMWEKRNMSPLLVRLQAGIATLEISLVVLRKLDLAIPLLGICLEGELYVQCNKDACSAVFTAASFIIARSWKEHRCSSTNEWIEKMWYIYTMEHYSAIKNNYS